MLHYPKSDAEWLKLRHGHVSSTESAALFGMSPYMTAFELAVNKREPEPTQIESTDRMVWGTRLQDAIARGIAEDYGVHVRRLNAYASIEGHKMGASFDYDIVGIDDDPRPQFNDLRVMYEEHGPGILEIKKVDSYIWKQQWKQGDELGIEAPDHIEIQVQHQLECMNREWAAIGVLVGGNEAHLLIRRRYRDVGNSILVKINAFWRNLEKGILPDPELPADAKIIRQLYNYAEPGKVVDLNHDVGLQILCSEYRHAADFASDAKETMETCMAKILQIIGHAERVLVGTHKITSSMIPEAPISYVRKAYRRILITPTKQESKDAK